MDANVAQSNLDQLGQRLREQKSDVGQFLDSLPRWTDVMIDAVDRRQWDEVERLGEFVAASARVFNCNEVADASRAVAAAARQPGNELAVKRALIHLLGTVGRQRIQLDAIPAPHMPAVRHARRRLN